MWSCLAGVSSPFSPSSRVHEWLICMWTGAFTSVCIENAACRLPRGGLIFVVRIRAVKNWKRRQIFYPCAALRRPLKHYLFMYNRETFKIIGFSLSILFFSFSFPFFTHTYTHTCTHQPSEGKVKSLLCNLSADWRALNRARQSRETLVESFISAS